jgi:hypothetical protein
MPQLTAGIANPRLLGLNTLKGMGVGADGTRKKDEQS